MNASCECQLWVLPMPTWSLWLSSAFFPHPPWHWAPGPLHVLPSAWKVLLQLTCIQLPRICYFLGSLAFDSPVVFMAHLPVPFSQQGVSVTRAALSSGLFCNVTSSQHRTSQTVNESCQLDNDLSSLAGRTNSLRVDVSVHLNVLATSLPQQSCPVLT